MSNLMHLVTMVLVYAAAIVLGMLVLDAILHLPYTIHR